MNTALARAIKTVAQEELLRLAADQEREAELGVLERYRFDPLAHLEDGHVWIWAKEERKPIRLDPFDSQVESLLAWIDIDHLKRTGRPRFNDVVEEKSRAVGASWIYCYGAWWAITHHSVQGLALHLKAAKVDDGGPRSTRRSLFGKIRFMHRRMPAGPWKAPLVFRPFSTEPAKIENPERESVLYGEGATSDPGRGDDLDFVLADEMAFVPWGEAVHSACGEACPHGKVYVSSVHGDDNVHARLADERPANVVYLRHHWKDNPVYGEGLHVAGEKPDCVRCQGNRAGVRWDPRDPDAAHRYAGRLTSPWYDLAVLGKTDEQVAQELDIDRTRALGGRVYDEFELERHVAPEPIAYDEHLPLELGGDWGLDFTSIVICQDHPAEFRVIGEVEVSGMTPDQVSAVLRDALVEVGVAEELTTPYWTRKLHARGDASGDSKSVATGATIHGEYRKQGFNFLGPPTHLVARFGTGANAVKRLLAGYPKPLVVSPSCEQFIRHVKNNRWPTDKLGRRRVGATRPLDDEHNHMMDAFRYLVVSKFPPPVEEDPLEGAGGSFAEDDRERPGRTARLTEFRQGMAA